MNKKGQVLSDALLYGWRIFIVVLIIIFAVFAVGPIFSAKQDIRQSEAVLLSDKILDCISKEGVIKSDFNLENCVNIDAEQYYLNASLNSLDSGFANSSVIGNSLELPCKNAEKYISPPSCISQKYYLLIDNNGKIEKGVLNLLVGIKKFDENV
jgi:hypothetical protein